MAAFASPEIYKLLEAEGFLSAIRRYRADALDRLFGPVIGR